MYFLTFSLSLSTSDPPFSPSSPPCPLSPLRSAPPPRSLAALAPSRLQPAPSSFFLPRFLARAGSARCTALMCVITNEAPVTTRCSGMIERRRLLICGAAMPGAWMVGGRCWQGDELAVWYWANRWAGRFGVRLAGDGEGVWLWLLKVLVLSGGLWLAEGRGVLCV